MIITRTTDLSREALFNAIKTSLKADYKSATHQDLFDHAIKSGLTYIKTFGKNHQNSIKIQIQEVAAPERYSVLYSSNQGKQLITYCLESLENGDTKITYQQEVLPDGLIQKANHYLTNLIFKKTLAKRIDAQLQGFIHFTKHQLS